LHPAKSAANHATPRNLLLFFVQNNPAIMIPSLLLHTQIGSAIMAALTSQNLLLLSVQDNSAIMMAKHTSYSLQLIITFIKTNANIPLIRFGGSTTCSNQSSNIPIDCCI
jgi:hypothetical protein